jgi:hypothetical protein
VQATTEKEGTVFTVKRWYGRSLLTRLVVSFLAVAIPLVLVGAVNYEVESWLRGRVSAMTERDFLPLADLRQAQSAAYQVTIAGIVGSTSSDPGVKKAMATNRRKFLADFDKAMATLDQHTPVEMGRHTEAINGTWISYKRADDAYQEGVDTPQAPQLNQAAAAQFDVLNTRFTEMAEALRRDADAQRDHAHSTLGTVQSLTVLGVVLGVLLAVVLGIVTGRSLRR